MDEFLEKFNDPGEQDLFAGDQNTYQLQGSLPYLCPIFFFIPIIVNKDSSYCRFHANQQLAWLICMIIIGIALAIIGIIPILGALVGLLGRLAMIIVSIVLCYGAYKGYAVKIPILGDIIRFF